MPGLNGSVKKRWALLPLSALVGLTLCIGRSHDANGQGLVANTGQIGIRHQLIAAIEADQDAASEKGDAKARSATVDILLRILSYASDYRFYGAVDGKFSGFDPAKGAAAQEIWADQKCHEDRGFPRIWVLAINGRIARGDAIFDIDARPRHIGKLVPSDEIFVQKDRKMEFTDPNESLVTLATTTASRLRVELTLKSTKCRRNED